jgi:hypothetical protein
MRRIVTPAQGPWATSNLELRHVTCAEVRRDGYCSHLSAGRASRHLLNLSDLLRFFHLAPLQVAIARATPFC